MVTKLTGTQKCGWCQDDIHEDCIGYVKNYDTIWICGCTEAGCGAASPRYTAKFGEVGAKPREETVAEKTDEPSQEGQADAGTETILLDEPVKDRGTDSVGAKPKGSRTRKKST